MPLVKSDKTIQDVQTHRIRKRFAKQDLKMVPRLQPSEFIGTSLDILKSHQTFWKFRKRGCLYLMQENLAGV